jgi:hypothetical protein
MKKYLLLLTIINGVLGSWASDGSFSSDSSCSSDGLLSFKGLDKNPWAFGKSMKASAYLKRPADQENVVPCAAGKALKSTDSASRPLLKSKTSLNLLADAELASPSLASSFASFAAVPHALAPQHDRYTKYYHNLDFIHRGIAGAIIKLRINRDLPCKRTGEVYPATCRLEFNEQGFSERTPTVFTQQSFEGPHDSYEVPVDSKPYNKFVIRIPTLVENLVGKTNKLPAQLVFHKPDGQVKELPLELESLSYDKP